MNNNVTSTSTSVYRSADHLIHTCSVCGAEATFCCPRCGRPLCSPHAVGVDTRCAECESAYQGSKAGPWVSALASLAVGVPLIALMFVFEVGFVNVAFVPLVVLSVALVASFVSKGFEAHARAAFLGEGSQDFVLGALAINPEAGESAGHRNVQIGRAPGYDASRGIPSVPIYQKTFGH